MTVYVLPFEKMNGLGNDFILIEKRLLPNGINEKSLAILLCNRNFSIGADGIIIVDFSKLNDADFEWSYYNSDGSEAEMCGNGMRCFAKYVYERGFTDMHTFSVKTKAGIIKPTLENDGTITVNMGVPKLPSKLHDEIVIDHQKFDCTYVEVGNPHCVIFPETTISNDELLSFGPRIEKDKKFPHGVNVEFVEIINKSEVNTKVWERGCGPTLACGTGACASVIASSLRNLTDSKVKVNLPGGCLSVSWDRQTNEIYLNGPAVFSFTGQYNLDPKQVFN